MPGAKFELSPGNNFVIETDPIMIRNLTTGTLAAYTTPDLTGFITTQEDSLATAAHGSVSATLSHIGGNPKGDGTGGNYVSGQHQFALAGSALTAANLDPVLLGKDAWLVIKLAGNILKRYPVEYVTTSRASQSSV